MKKNKLAKDIIIYENFLTEKECKGIIEILESKACSGTLDWVPISFYESYASNIPQDNDPEIIKNGLPSNIFSKIESGIKQCISEIDELDISSIFKIGYHTQKWEPGAYARPHSDNTDEHGKPTAFERSKYAGFIYLNDDFDGGILKFVQSGITIKPKTGLLAVFSGGHENIHEVTMVTKGIRYTLGSFWDNKDELDYPEEVRNAWKEELKIVREQQEVEKKQWQDLLKQGYKLTKDGKKYKIDEL